jgi:hypothetical protein
MWQGFEPATFGHFSSEAPGSATSACRTFATEDAQPPRFVKRTATGEVSANRRLMPPLWHSCPKVERKSGRVRALVPKPTCRFAGTSRSGSDGTRTRDLRRDRRLRKIPSSAGDCSLQACSSWTRWMTLVGLAPPSWVLAASTLSVRRPEALTVPFPNSRDRTATPRQIAASAATPAASRHRSARPGRRPSRPKTRITETPTSNNLKSIRSLGSAQPVNRERSPRPAARA